MTTYDVIKYEIRYQWMFLGYILRLQMLLVRFLSNGTAKIKLAVLTFLYYGEFLINPINTTDGLEWKVNRFCLRSGEIIPFHGHSAFDV